MPKVIVIKKRAVLIVLAVLSLVASILSVGVSHATTAHADYRTANICFAVKGNTNYQGTSQQRDIGVNFDKSITGTPIPFSIKYLNEGECSKTKYPTLLPKYFFMPYKSYCLSQWGGKYVEGKLYYPTLISGTITFTCKNSTSGY